MGIGQALIWLRDIDKSERPAIMLYDSGYAANMVAGRWQPNANDEYNPWNNPAPLRAFTLATGFANQRGNAVMLLEANSRRRSQRANHRHASG